uniref:Cytochrome c oxidase subunit 7B, mitochondrial n=1 Tax=Sus scrofa TaxID=9823 RepID=A0A8D0Y2E1_PIG
MIHPEKPWKPESNRMTYSNFRTFPLAKNALSHLRVQSIQQTMARRSHQKQAPDFHDKYSNAILASGATFCVAVLQHKLELNGTCPLLAESPQRTGEKSNHLNWFNAELFQNHLIIDVK